MKKALVTLVVLAALGGSVYAYYAYRQTGPKFTVSSSAVTRGDIVDTVGATGTLQAVTTVQVGTQVSGTIQALYADFNSLVRKGQVLARLDPSLFQTQIEQARANLIRAQADLERLKVALDDAQTKLTRAQELSGRNLIPRTDLETAQVNVRAAQAQIRSSEAQVTQAQASLNQNQVSMEHTVIDAPIDGLVISRNVDVGQTVAASMQAPVLYVLAADLTKMQVLANLDESDVGRIRPGQKVTFRVDAYPADTFTGAVSQVRLSPTVQQNVVTYATVIDVPNDQLKLKPGMTANVNIEIARATNVLRVPNASLRFRPTNDIYAAIGQTPPDPAAGGEGFAGRRRGGAAEEAAAATPSGTPAAGRAGPASPASPGGPATPASPAKAPAGNEGSRTAQNASPEERERFLQRRRDRGSDPTASAGGAEAAPRGRGAAQSSTRAPAQVPAQASTRSPSATPGGATTIDALFGPLPRIESAGRVWVFTDNQLKSVRVRLGITDGQTTELIEGDLQQGAEVVSNIATTSVAARPAAGAAGNPFLGQQPARGAFPGGGGFGGGNRGGGAGGGGR